MLPVAMFLGCCVMSDKVCLFTRVMEELYALRRHSFSLSIANKHCSTLKPSFQNCSHDTEIYADQTVNHCS